MKPLTILLVDEHESSRLALVALLRGNGHEVISTGRWESAFALASEGPFDLLISELSLPDRMERKLMKELVSRYGTKGLLLTACEEQLAGGWRRAGFSRYLYKPVSYCHIQSVIVRLMSDYVCQSDVRSDVGLRFARDFQSRPLHDACN